MNLSYYSLTDPLPKHFNFVFGSETIMGNKDLCCENNISGFHYCFVSPHINIGSTSTQNVTKWIKIILPIVISFIFLLLRIVLLSCQKIIENIRCCIGTGGYGSIYKAMLPSGKVIALIKLHFLESQELAFDKSFRNEAEVLSEVRHHNIMKLYGNCLQSRCMVVGPLH